MDWGILENETEGVRIAGDKMLTKRQYSILSFYVKNIGDEESIKAGDGFKNRELAASGSLDYAGFYTIPLKADTRAGDRKSVV